MHNHFRLHEQEYLKLIGRVEPSEENNISAGHRRRRGVEEDDGPCQSAPKRRSLDIFSMFAEPDAPSDARAALDIDNHVSNELERYAAEQVDTSSQYEFDVLLWWKNNAKNYPLLAALSRFVLAIPASSGPSERLFSCAGSTISEKRTRLKPGACSNKFLNRSAILIWNCE